MGYWFHLDAQLPVKPIPPSAPQGPMPRIVSRKWLMLGGVGAVVLIGLLFAVGFFLLGRRTEAPARTSDLLPKPSGAVISGTFNINGTVPPNSRVVLSERKVGETDFHIVVDNLAAVDLGVWNWQGAEHGVQYELQAEILNNQTVLARSSTHVVAAPAQDEVMTINLEGAQPASTGAVPSQGFVPISGTIDLNGYVPAGSVITISQRKAADRDFVVVTQDIPAVDHSTWAWNGALPSTLYEIRAQVVSKGAIIAQSAVLSISAPASQERLIINSTAQPPAPTAGSISGTIDLNGYVSSGSVITIKSRVAGSNTDFGLVASVPAIDKTPWRWDQAKTGTKYDILAFLETNGKVYAQSQLLVVTAPAGSEHLVINASKPPDPPPGNNMTYNCIGKNSNGLWQVTLFYNNNRVVPGAKQYSVQLGNSSQDASLLNTTNTPSNPDQMQSVTTGYVLTEGTTYWGRFAYATCTDCSVFSPFSSDTAVSCRTQPTSAPAPTSTPVPPPPTAVPTAVPTLTPSPTLPPMTAKCNETCGSDGYTCVVGLQCISGEMIGSDVCRNPNCTDRADCVCF